MSLQEEDRSQVATDASENEKSVNRAQPGMKLLRFALKSSRRFIGVSIALLIMMIFLSIKEDAFLTSTNLTNILRARRPCCSWSRSATRTCS